LGWILQGSSTSFFMKNPSSKQPTRRHPRILPSRWQHAGSPMQCSLPSGRKMHGAASLAPFAPLLVIYGGWKTGADVGHIPVKGLGKKVNLEKLGQYVV